MVRNNLVSVDNIRRATIMCYKTGAPEVKLVNKLRKNDRSMRLINSPHSEKKPDSRVLNLRFHG